MGESKVDPVVKFLLIENRTVPVGRAGTREGLERPVQEKAGSANPTVGRGGAQQVEVQKMELTSNMFETQKVYCSS